MSPEIRMDSNGLVVITQEIIDASGKESPSVREIGQFLDRATLIFKGLPEETKKEAFEELVRRYSVFTTESTMLLSKTRVVPWVDDKVRADRPQWKLYEQFLLKKWSPSAIRELDRSTDKILDNLGNPGVDVPWAVKGLVVGRIQSGKTGNYIALANKAIDAGYKMIIVLAGLYNNLRSQTQYRFDEGLLGYTVDKYAVRQEKVGVGLLDSKNRVNSLTDRTDKGDFNRSKARVVNISPEEKPWLFVVKKNAFILEHLRLWIEGRLRAAGRDAFDFPLLMIDDEADNASIDTKFLEESTDGELDKDHDPTRINCEIRTILTKFSRSSYVGYTATPFANVFIHPDAATTVAGNDLFPSNFIMTLSAPSQHIDAEKLFGLGEEGQDGLPLTREVADTDTWMPGKHKKEHIPKTGGRREIPASLEEAVLSFLMSTAVKSLRKTGSPHSSMLIHVTRFQNVQHEVRKQVGNFLGLVNQKLMYPDTEEHRALKERFREIWEDPTKGFVITNRMLLEGPCRDLAGELPSFDRMFEVLPEIADSIELKEINGSAGDVLDYGDNPENPRNVIVIGGDKLSRGLTLEGLSVSYFTRPARMYDTLMQMGRWFGYRMGYLDLCRLYLPKILEDRYRYIAEATRDIFEQFDYAVDHDLSPDEYGIRIKKHPSLMITSPLKMRTATRIRCQLNGTIFQVNRLKKDEATRAANLKRFASLVKSMGTQSDEPILKREMQGSNINRVRLKGNWWKDVELDKILDFIKGFVSAEDNTGQAVIPDFLEKMRQKGELTRWTVAIIGSKDFLLDDSIKLYMTKRKAVEGENSRNIYHVKSLVLGHDEAIEVNEEDWKVALEYTRKHRPAASQPSTAEIRNLRGLGYPGRDIAGHPETGLLLIYILDPADAGCEGDPFITYALSFPASNNPEESEYAVNRNYLLDEDWQ